jgi:hypothetical protein
LSPETDQSERFIVDAQLPRSLAVRLKELGYDAAFGQADFIELGTTALTLHPRRERS